MADAGTMAEAESAAAAARKRKRSAQGCVCEENDVLVEELKKVKGKLRDPTSHLAANYTRAISSIMHHDAPIRDGKQAKTLRNIGNYLANQIQAILQKKGLLRPIASSDSSGSGAAAPPPSHAQRVQKQRKQAPDTAAAVQAALAQAVANTKAPIATRVTSESAHKEYAPAYRKQPWFVIKVMSEERATAESSAIAVDALLLKMQSVGYDGNLVRLKTCIALLCGTHEVVRKTSAGLLFLTEKGKHSAHLCPGTLSTPDEVQASALAASATPVLASASVSTVPSPTLQHQRPSTTSSSAVSATNGVYRAAATDHSIVCIDLSDSEDELTANYAVGDDSDAPVTDTLRVGISPRPTVDNEIDNTFSFEFEPDEEPPSMLSDSSQSQNVESSVHAGGESGVVSDSDEWELVLILDHREIISRQNRNILERKLLEHNVTCEVRSLNVGDVQWIAKRYRNGEVNELVLNAIVERKEVKDLSGSIIDRRYTEQKVRLRASGLTHIIYLIEGSFSQQTTIRSGGLQTALCRTQVQNQFFVQVCQNADETVAFLAAVHSRLLAKFPREKCRNPEARASPLHQQSTSSSNSRLPMQATRREFEQVFCHPAQTFSTFNSLFRKKTQFTVSEIYQMMLTQVPGLNATKAVGVSSAHPTFRELRHALMTHDTRKRDECVENIRCGESQRRLGVKSRENLSYLLTSAVYSDNEEVSAAQE